MKNTCLLASLCVAVIGMLFTASPAAAQYGKKKKEIEVRPAIVPEGPQVRLYVEGAYCAGCAEVLASTLASGGVDKASKIAPNGGDGYVIVMGGFPHDSDLSPLAKAINAAATPHRGKAKPGVALELFAKLDEKSAAAALSALEKVEGVDAKGSAADIKRGSLSVRLKGDKKVSVNSLIAALAKSGIEAKVVDGVAAAPAKDKAPAEKDKAKS